jgi:hypothetical protein
MFELLILIMLIGAVAQACCGTQDTGRSQREQHLAQEHGMALTAYLEWQRWCGYARIWRCLTLGMLGFAVLLLCGMGGYPAHHSGQDLLTGLFILTAVLSGAWGWCRQRASTLEP